MFKNGKYLSVTVPQRRKTKFEIDVYFRDMFYPEIRMHYQAPKTFRDRYQISFVYDCGDNSYYFDKERFDKLFIVPDESQEKEDYFLDYQFDLPDAFEENFLIDGELLVRANNVKGMKQSVDGTTSNG